MAQIVEPLFIDPPITTPRYPFSQWLDGRAWSLKSGDDYTCSDLSMERQLRRAAARRNKRLAVQFTLTGVTIQAW